MTLIYEPEQDILKVCRRAKNKISRLRLSKVRARIEQTDEQIDRHTDATECITTPHLRVVTASVYNAKKVNLNIVTRSLTQAMHLLQSRLTSLSTVT